MEARNVSKWSERVRLSSSRSFSSREKTKASRVSISLRSQFTCSWSQMCMYSKPTLRVYVSCSRSMMSRSFTGPRDPSRKPDSITPPSENSLSRSASVKP